LFSKNRIIVRNLQEKKFPVSKEKIIRLTRKILKSKECQNFGLSILFVDEEFIKHLNSKYLKRRYTTDVLAFPLGKNPENFLGDIVISVDSAIKNSSTFRTTPKSEILLYLIHGILHLLGYKDKTKEEKKIIENEQRRIFDLLKDDL